MGEAWELVLREVRVTQKKRHINDLIESNQSLMCRGCAGDVPNELFF